MKSLLVASIQISGMEAELALPVHFLVQRAKKLAFSTDGAEKLYGHQNIKTEIPVQ